MQDQVRAYYEHLGEREWHRLARHRVEFAVTLRALRDHLQPASRILDVGGGPGRYAVALAGAGHRVTLLDLVPRFLQQAREHAEDRRVALAGALAGDATDLSRFDSASFDAVLLLGPLYHLPEPEQRLQALREARRVLAPGGLLFAAFLTRYAPLRRLARRDPAALLAGSRRYEALLERGVLPPPAEEDELPGGYFARADGIAPLLESGGFETLRLLAAEGILDGIEERVSALYGPAWQAWADLNYDLAEDPGLLASTSHILAVAERVDPR